MLRQNILVLVSNYPQLNYSARTLHTLKMSGRNSKNMKVVRDLYKVRSRKLEIAEGLFLCPFITNRGTSCRVAQKFRSLKTHCENMHKGKIALKCAIDNCGWSCIHSIRCLTSHRDNLENHGNVPYNGGENLDGNCVVIPFVLADIPGELVDNEHFPQCVEAKIALKRFSGKMLKREERAAAAAKLKKEALKKVFESKKPSGAKPVIIAFSKQSVSKSKRSHPPKPSKVVCEPEGGLDLEVTSSRNAKVDAWKKASLEIYTSAMENSKKGEVIATVVKSIVSSKICKETLEREASPVVGKKRKAEISHAEKREESSRPLKKRRSACEFEKQPTVESTVPLAASLASGEGLSAPAAKVTQPNKTLSPVQLELEAELNLMREKGFEKTDFVKLLKNFGLNEVLNLVGGEDRIDQKNLRNSLSSIAYKMLKGQSARYSCQNPVLYK